MQTSGINAPIENLDADYAEPMHLSHTRCDSSSKTPAKLNIDEPCTVECIKCRAPRILCFDGPLRGVLFLNVLLNPGRPRYRMRSRGQQQRARGPHCADGRLTEEVTWPRSDLERRGTSPLHQHEKVCYHGDWPERAFSKGARSNWSAPRSHPGPHGLTQAEDHWIWETARRRLGKHSMHVASLRIGS